MAMSFIDPSMFEDDAVNGVRRLVSQNELLRGESARRKVALQESNKGVSRLSARVQRLKDQVEKLYSALRLHDPQHEYLPENRSRYHHGKFDVGFAMGRNAGMGGDENKGVPENTPRDRYASETIRFKNGKVEG